MSLVHHKSILTFLAAILLVASSITSSGAKPYPKRPPHPKRPHPPQSEPYNYDLDYNTLRDWDSSCFRSTGLPAQYACSSRGG